jgi:sulfatase maturation enzyme AslB (radical SAM superfamily)
MIKIHAHTESPAVEQLPASEPGPAPVNDWAIQPDVFFLELTNHCNMHCTFCPSDYLKKDRAMADDALAIRFIEQVRDLGLNRPIQFSVLGEPLLNKKIYKYIDLCERYGIEVYLISNISILDAERARAVFKHHNVALVLSLQTPTEDSYRRLRGYDKLTFDQYFDRILPALREKFMGGSQSRVEVHVTSTSHMRADGSVHSDFALDMWDAFGVEDKDAFVRDLMDRFDGYAEQLRAEFPEQFALEDARSRVKYADHIDRNHIAASRETVPEGAVDMIEERFWGYMFAPNCFIRFKTFGLWTREESFMKTFLPKQAKVYVEEREEALDCSMAHNVAMLADGQLSLCCLDYEGEMGLPNLRETSLVELLRSPERRAIATDAMRTEVCRRCQGNLFVFDTEPDQAAASRIDKFGRGWYPYEPDMNGIGGRWSNGEAWAYVLARQDSTALVLRLLSVHDSSSPLTVRVREYDEASKEFGAVTQALPFAGRQNEMIEVELPVTLRAGTLYRIDLLSPTFVPGAPDGSGDQRKLGLMLFDASVGQLKPVAVPPVVVPPPAPPEPEPAAPAELVVAEAQPDVPAKPRRWLDRLFGRS